VGSLSARLLVMAVHRLLALPDSPTLGPARELPHLGCAAPQLHLRLWPSSRLRAALPLHLWRADPPLRRRLQLVRVRHAAPPLLLRPRL
jgi:hypothetical protein